MSNPKGGASKRRRGDTIVRTSALPEFGITFSRTYLKQLEDRDSFPKRVRLGAGKAFGYRLSEIEAYLKARPIERRPPPFPAELMQQIESFRHLPAYVRGQNYIQTLVRHQIEQAEGVHVEFASALLERLVAMRKMITTDPEAAATDAADIIDRVHNWIVAHQVADNASSTTPAQG